MQGNKATLVKVDATSLLVALATLQHASILEGSTRAGLISALLAIRQYDL
jgi:hypothetical protein